MDKLSHLLNEIEIDEIVSINENIKEETDVNEKIELLESLDIEDSIIRNIIKSNPFFLTRTTNDLKELITRLKKIGIIEFDTMFDTYPYLLNKNSYEIDEFLKANRDKTDEDIKEILESRPYEIDEINEI